MLHWLSDLLFGTPYRRSRISSVQPIEHLEQSVAWSSFLASGVDGVEDISFSEFVRRQNQTSRSRQ
jgi:hypothetical protein